MIWPIYAIVLEKQDIVDVLVLVIVSAQFWFRLVFLGKASFTKKQGGIC